MARTIKDFNKLIPETRIAQLAGKEIDVTRIPSRVTLMLAEYADTVNTLSPREGFIGALEPIVAVCQLTDPEVTVDWLLDNTDFEQLNAFTDFVLEPIRARTQGGQAAGKKSAK